MLLNKVHGGSEKVRIDGETVRRKMNLITLNNPIFNPIVNLYIKSSSQALGVTPIGADEYATFIMLQEGSNNYYLYKLNEISKRWEQYTDNNFYARGIPTEITTPTRVHLLYPSWQSNYIMSCKNEESNWTTVDFSSGYVPVTSGRYMQKLNGCLLLQQNDNSILSKYLLLNDSDNSITELGDFPERNYRESQIGGFLEFKEKLYFFNRKENSGTKWTYTLWSFDGDAWMKEIEIPNIKLLAGVLYSIDDYIYFYEEGELGSNYKLTEWRYKNGETTKTRELLGLDGYIFRQKTKVMYFNRERGIPGDAGYTDWSAYGEFYRNGFAEI